MESRRFIWRDSKLLLTPLLPTWTSVALVSVLAGLVWRFIPGSNPPELYFLLDLCGLILWLSGWVVANSLVSATNRSFRFQIHQAEPWSQIAFLSLSLVCASICLSLAPAGALLGYDLSTLFQQLSTQDVPQLNVSLGGLAIVSLAVGGSICVLAGGLLALVAAWLAGRASGIVWLLITCFTQLSTLGGLGNHISRLGPGGDEAFSWIPPTLGVCARLVMARLADPSMRYEYLQPITGSTLGVATAILLALVSANVIVGSRLPEPKVHQPIIAATIGGMLATACYVISQMWVYVTVSSVPAPGAWTTVIAIGPLACISLLSLGRQDTKEPPRMLLVAWPVLLLLVCTALTATHVWAGQVAHTEVLVQAMLMLPVLSLGITLLANPSASRSAALPVVPICFVLLAVPLIGKYSMVDLARTWTLSADHLYISCALALLTMLLFYRYLAARSSGFLLGRDINHLRPAI